MRERRLDEAVLALERSLVDDPHDARSLLTLAECQLRRGLPEQALRELERAEVEAGITARSSRLRGDALYRLAGYDEAEAAYRHSEALGGRGTWSLVQIARCRLRARDPEGAMEAAALALEREPESADALVAMGEGVVRKEGHQAAESWFARAHAAAADNQFAYSRLIEARIMQLPEGDRLRELELIQRTTGTGNRYLQSLLARIRREQGDTGGSVEAWAKAARQGDAFARKNYGYALRKAGRLEEAAQVMRESLFAFPQDVVLFRNFVRLMRERGALNELRLTLEDLLPVAGPRRGAVYGELSRLPRE